jgi:hypothetical protein
MRLTPETLQAHSVIRDKNNPNMADMPIEQTFETSHPDGRHQTLGTSIYA